MNEASPSSATVIERQNDPAEIEVEEQLVEEETLVEEVSIDGMCGVY
jgi:mycofactocin precursor